MNWDQVEGQWKTLKGSVRDHWGKLTDQDFESIAGKREKLLGKLQERYGLGKEKAESQLDDFISSINSEKKRGMSSQTMPLRSSTTGSNIGQSSGGKSHDPSSITMDMDVKKN